MSIDIVAFRNTVQNTIASFSIGDYTLRETVSSNYDASTGTKTYTTLDHTGIPAARYDAEEDWSEKDIQGKNVETVVIAGNDLPQDVFPKIGFVVVYPDGQAYPIVNIKSDQYGAAYFLLVEKK